VKNYTVKTEIYEGPLDLLLSLIEKRKLFINDISLATVAEDYISYVNNLPEYSIADRADFILIASTLILIKSRSLLPTLDLTEEEQENINDLEIRLKEYKRIKELSLHIRDLYGKNISYVRRDKKWNEILFRASPYINIGTIHEHIENVIISLPQFQKLPEVIVQKIRSLEEAMEDLSERIKKALKMNFAEIAGEIKTKEDKVNVIVTFLAMLELVKQGVIDVTQDSLFEPIDIETDKVGLPRYQ
jgi:segregation and condensation protein A